MSISRPTRFGLVSSLSGSVAELTGREGYDAMRIGYRRALLGLAARDLSGQVGFDDVAPNTPRNISSWACDFAANRVEVIDNRALVVPCCHPGYT